MAENEVTIRNPHTMEERVIPKEAAPFFVKKGQDWQVLDSRGHVSASATTAAKKESN